MIRRAIVGAAALGVIGFFPAGPALAGPGQPAPVVADEQDDEKKAEKEWKEAEEKQKKEGGQKPGEGQPGGQPGAGGGLEENPLPKILELMKQVEGRLFEADTGDFTQDEQRQIIEAMRFEEKSHEALEELIKKIEEQAQKQQSQSQSQSQDQKDQQKQKQQQNQNETEEQKRQREQEEQRRREQQKREEEQRRMQQQNQQQQPQDQQQKPQQDRQQKSEQEQREGRPPQDDQNPLDDPERRAGRWGVLPRKLFQDAANARNHEPPSRYRDLIEKYRQRLADTNPSPR